MYKKIVNPDTRRKVLINSKLGKDILRNYISFYNRGGASLDHSQTPLDIFSSKKPCDKNFFWEDTDSDNIIKAIYILKCGLHSVVVFKHVTQDIERTELSSVDSIDRTIRRSLDDKAARKGTSESLSTGSLGSSEDSGHSVDFGDDVVVVADIDESNSKWLLVELETSDNSLSLKARSFIRTTDLTAAFIQKNSDNKRTSTIMTNKDMLLDILNDNTGTYNGKFKRGWYCCNSSGCPTKNPRYVKHDSYIGIHDVPSYVNGNGCIGSKNWKICNETILVNNKTLRIIRGAAEEYLFNHPKYSLVCIKGSGNAHCQTFASAMFRKITGQKYSSVELFTC